MPWNDSWNARPDLLIRGFGVQVPGGALVLTWLYSLSSMWLSRLWGVDGALLGHAGRYGRWLRARAIGQHAAFTKRLSSRYSHLAVAGRGGSGRDMGHGPTGKRGSGHAAGSLDDHVGGGLGGLVRDLGQDAGIGVSGGDDAGVAEHLLDHLQVGLRGQGQSRRSMAKIM